MDYTKIPRPLFLKDRNDLDDFHVDDEESMLSQYFERLSQRPFILRSNDGVGTVLAIFNNAYYITKLVMKEKRPLLYIQKYLNIASDDYLNKEWEYHVCPATMALVCNLLLWNESLYEHKWEIFIEKVQDQFRDWGMIGNEEGKEDFEELYIDSFSSVPDFFIFNKDFLSPSINDQTIQETEKFLSQHSSSWGQLTHDYNPDSINDLVSAVCHLEEEKNLLVAAIQKEAQQKQAYNDRLQPSVEFPQNTCSNKTEAELRRELEEAQQRIKELESEKASEEWISCFDGFLHPSLNPQAIAEALKDINSSHLSKNERGYWWVFNNVLIDIHWMTKSNHKLILQWANLHFHCGWDWTKDHQFKFSDITKAIKTKPSSKWNKKEIGTALGDYYGEQVKAMKDCFTEDVGGGKIVDRGKFYKKDCTKRINDGH
jgi:hypothetical protein